MLGLTHINDQRESVHHPIRHEPLDAVLIAACQKRSCIRLGYLYEKLGTQHGAADHFVLEPGGSADDTIKASKEDCPIPSHVDRLVEFRQIAGVERGGDHPLE